MKKSFIIIEALIYLAFITMDLMGIDSTYIKYSGIVLCLIFAIYNRKKFQSASMVFTLIADFFLLVLNNHYEIGLLSFIIVQIIYFYFLGNIEKSYFNMFLFIRGFLIIVGSLILPLFNAMNLLNELVLIYFINLLLNAIEAWISGNRTLAIGLALFVCCDVCVGLHNINAAFKLATFLMWVFYLPSQVLIVLS